MPDYTYTKERHAKAADLLEKHGGHPEKVSVRVRLDSRGIHTGGSTSCVSGDKNADTLLSWREILASPLPVCHRCAILMHHTNGSNLVGALQLTEICSSIKAKVEEILSPGGITRANISQLEALFRESFWLVSDKKVLPRSIGNAFKSLNAPVIEFLENPLPEEVIETLIEFLATAPASNPTGKPVRMAPAASDLEGWVILIPSKKAPGFNGYLDWLLNKAITESLQESVVDCATFSHRLLFKQYNPPGRQVLILPGRKAIWKDLYAQESWYDKRFSVFEVKEKPDDKVLETFAALIKGNEGADEKVLLGLYESALDLEKSI